MADFKRSGYEADFCEKCSTPIKGKAIFSLRIQSGKDRYEVPMCGECIDQLRDFIYPQYKHLKALLNEE